MKRQLFIFMAGVAALVSCAGDQTSNLPTLVPAIDVRPVGDDATNGAFQSG